MALHNSVKHLFLTAWSRMRCNLANDIFDARVLAVLERDQESRKKYAGTIWYIRMIGKLRLLFSNKKEYRHKITSLRRAVRDRPRSVRGNPR